MTKLFIAESLRIILVRDENTMLSIVHDYCHYLRVEKQWTESDVFFSDLTWLKIRMLKIKAIFPMSRTTRGITSVFYFG